MKTIGIDLSLCSTGVSLIKGKDFYFFKNIKTKPSGKLPLDELNRLRSITKSLEEIIIEHEPDLILIEGLAFSVRKTTSLVQLAALNYFVRMVAQDLKIPFVIVAATTLKKFITGKGNSPKDNIMLEIYKKYGYTILDNNIADSFVLATIGQALLKNPLKKLIQPEEEVIKLLKKQL